MNSQAVGGVAKMMLSHDRHRLLRDVVRRLFQHRTVPGEPSDLLFCLSRYPVAMNSNDFDVLERIGSWPPDDRDELLAIAASIEARRAGLYVLTLEERSAIRQGLAELDRGEYASDEDMAAFWANVDHP